MLLRVWKNTRTLFEKVQANERQRPQDFASEFERKNKIPLDKISEMHIITLRQYEHKRSRLCDRSIKIEEAVSRQRRKPVVFAV
jgi:hypothetical protein